MNKKAVHSLQIPVPKEITRWVDRPLAEICELVNGRGFKPYEWKRRGLPIIRIQNLNGSKDFNFYDGEFDEKILVEPGQLLFAWSGSRGASFGPHVWTGPKGVLNYHTWRVIPKSGTDRDFLFQLLEFETQNIEASSHGASALVHVQKWEIEKRVFGVPPLSEQRKIAEILRTWDEAIEKAERLLDAAQRQYEALRTELYREDGSEERLSFGDFLEESRIPGDDGTTARKLTVKLYGKGIEPKQDRTAGSANTRYYIRRAGQFIYSRLDFLNGAFAVVPPHLDGFQSTLDLPAFDIAPRVNAIWLLNYFTRTAYYENQQNLARGQRVARRINPDDLLASEIAVPTRDRQDEVAAILIHCSGEINGTRSMAEALRRQKRGLMQKLLTGKIRVAGAVADLSPAAD